MVASQSPVGVAVVHDGIVHANKRLQHSPAVAEMHAGDDGVRPVEACCSMHVAGGSEAASNEGILAAANVQQHTGTRQLAVPLQEHGAAWLWKLEHNQTGTLAGKAVGLLDYPAAG